MNYFKTALLTITFLASSASQATILTFDELSQNHNAPITSVYGGFSWDSNFYVTASQGGISGSTSLVNGYGVKTAIAKSQTNFDLSGAWFKNLAGTTSITVEGYNSSKLVGSATMALNGTFSWLKIDMLNINEVRFISSSNSAWWLMDDLTINTSNKVSAPANITLLMLGLVAIGFSRRRLQQKCLSPNDIRP